MENKYKLIISLVILIIVVSIIVVVSTYNKFSLTVDEPCHIASGMEWLQKGTYYSWPENPPLPRIFAALLPFLSGARIDFSQVTRQSLLENQLLTFWTGAELINNDPGYPGYLFLARLGILPFFIFSLILVFLLGKKMGGVWCGVISLFLFATLPPVLGHAGLATTDIPALTMFLFMFYSFLLLIEKPDMKRIILFGVSIGLGIITKFSIIMFIIITMFFILILYILLEKIIKKEKKHIRWSILLGGGTLMIVIILFIIWAGYGFSIGKLSDSLWFSAQRSDYPTEFGYKLVTSNIPAPSLLLGWFQLTAHNAVGHTAYAMGNTSQTGFPFYYPLALSVKTPLIFLFLSIAGFIIVLIQGIKKRELNGLALCIAILALFIPLLGSKINIGIRHLLPLYPLLAVAASLGLIFILKKMQSRFPRGILAAGALLAVFQLSIAAFSYPGYISYFNIFGGKDPGSILVDSDLDWGQDIPLLEDFCKKNKIEELNIAYWGYGSLCRYNLPKLKPIDPYVPVTGWIAVSEFHYRGVAFWGFKELCNPRTIYFENQESKGSKRFFEWLYNYKPVGFAGKSIRIYYIPAGA